MIYVLHSKSSTIERDLLFGDLLNREVSNIKCIEKPPNKLYLSTIGRDLLYRDLLSRESTVQSFKF